MDATNFNNIPKLLPPKLNNAYLRERLFSVLDEQEHQRVIWVSSPAGSGKTTLIASYLGEKEVPSIWYQIDEGDADVASFFYYLGLSEQKLNTGKFKTLPNLTAEYQQSLSVFARNYFRDFFGRIDNSSVIVFDNYQEVPCDSLLHGVINILLDETPDHVQVILLSRENPPAKLSRTSLSSDFYVLNWDEIKLTDEECFDVIQHRHKTDLTKEQLKIITSVSHGWMAGLILLLKQEDTNTSEFEAQHSSSQSELFGYFTNEVFNILDEGAQQTLLLTSLFPSFTMDMAKALTGQTDVEQLIASLVSSQFFISQHAYLTDSYNYHPLFRTFLHKKFITEFDTNRQVEIQLHAAQLLLENGQKEDAAALYIKTYNWDELSLLIMSHAPNLISQGRYKTLQLWINSIPDDIRTNNPWLLYWLGNSFLAFSPGQARDYFEQAFNKFKDAQIQEGELLSWSGIIDSIINSWDDFTPLSNWIRWFEKRYTPSSDLISHEIEGRVACSMLSALMISQPTNKHITQWQERLIGCRTTDVGTKLSAYIFSINYYVWLGEDSKCYALADELKAMAALKDIPPMVVIIAQWIEAATAAWLGGDMENALKSIENTLDYANRHGIYIWHHMLYAVGIHALLTSGKTTEAAEYIDKLETTLNPSRQHNYSLYHYLKGWKFYQSNEFVPALTHAQRALEIAIETDYKFPIMLCQLEVINIHIAQGDYSNSRKCLNEITTQINDTGSAYFQFSYYLSEADLNRRQGNLDITLNYLRKAMSAGKEKNLLGLLWWWSPPVMAELCSLALEHGIEPDYVKKLIHQRKLLPPDRKNLPCNWPWPVKIFTLGRFDIVIDDQIIDGKNKGLNKQLELLKALISFGGKDVNEQKLSDVLWPDTDGDQAKQNLNTTLYRLRKLFQGHDVIILRNKQFSLDSRFCWLDTWAISDLLSKTDKMIGHSGECVQLLENICELYQSAFLSGEDSNWLLSLREKLHAQVIDKIVKLSIHLEKEDQLEHASNGYNKLLEIDFLIEEAYQGLMRSYSRQGKKANAIAVYQKCKSVFNQVLGVGPSSATEELYTKIITSS
jgi:ATP/maltotriose-dependent transcriptional regulator MalT/DNA-binding SARP family transcriptional activator